MKRQDFANRLKQAIAASGLPDSQSELAKTFGVSGVMVWSYRNGEKLPRMSTALRIAEALKVNVEWLLSGTGPMSASSMGQPAETTNQHGYFAAPFFETPDAPAPMMFSEAWLENKGLNQDHISMFVLRDESMSPSLPKNSMLLINQTVKVLENGKAYLIRWNGSPLMRRAFLQISGQWSLRYDNPDKILYPDNTLTREEVESLQIIGQLVTPLGTL